MSADTATATATPHTSAPKGNVRWMMIFMVFVMGAVSYLDRNNLSIVAAAIIARTIEARLVEARPRSALVAVTIFAFLPRPGFAARRPVAKVPARPVPEFTVGEAAFAALVTRRTIAFESWTVSAIEFPAISARLEVPLLATAAVIAVEARRARTVAVLAAGCSVVIPAARRAVVAATRIGALAALTLAKPALGELLLGPARRARAALAA